MSLTVRVSQIALRKGKGEISAFRNDWQRWYIQNYKNWARQENIVSFEKGYGSLSFF